MQLLSHNAAAIECSDGSADADSANGQGSYGDADTTSSGTEVHCRMPAAAAGSYQVRVATAAGFAHPMLQVLNAPRIVSVVPPAGSLAGGQVVTVATASVPLATAEGQTQVKVNGLPCEVLNVQEDSVTCRTHRAFAALPTTVCPALARTCNHLVMNF